MDNQQNTNQDFIEWDVDSCYNSLEPPEHWALKRAFLQKHYKKFPKYRLIALANTFYNMEFMRARYVPQVECLVDQLAKEVPEIVNYREGRRHSLKRTFVSASDASRSKIQRTKIDIPTQPFEKSTDTSINLPIQQNNHLNYHNDLIDKIRRQPGCRSKLVLFEHSNGSVPYQIIAESAQKAQLEVVLRRTGRVKDSLIEFELLIDKEMIASDFAESEKKAKDIVARKALELLKETCFTIITKTHLEGESLNKADTTESQVETKTELIPSENKGAKIMRLMGWTGKGLGKNSDGIQKPIEVTENISRLGLNLGNDKGYKILRDKVTMMLDNYLREGMTHNIVFSNEFSNEERKIVHGIAQKLKLKSKSYGKDSNRQLVVSRKLSSWELVDHLLRNNNCTPNYELKIPIKFS